jgi:hypothetical protein
LIGLVATVGLIVTRPLLTATSPIAPSVLTSQARSAIDQAVAQAEADRIEAEALATALAINTGARQTLTSSRDQAQANLDVVADQVIDDSARIALSDQLLAAGDLLAQAVPADAASVSDQNSRLTQATADLGAANTALTDSHQAWLDRQPSYDGSNGHLNPGDLCPISYQPTLLLRCDAEAAWERLNSAYQAVWQENIPVDLSYRTYDEQVEMRQIWGSGAAIPGTSNHGWGTAVDLPDYRLVDDPDYWMADLGAEWNYGSPKYEWMKANAPAFDWVNPSWAVQGGIGPHEPWHFEYVG